MNILGQYVTPFVYVLTLNDIVVRSRLLQKVIESVTTNFQSLTLTFIFIIIVIYHFTLLGQLYFRDDYLFHLPTPKIGPNGTIVDSVDMCASTKDCLMMNGKTVAQPCSLPLVVGLNLRHCRKWNP